MTPVSRWSTTCTVSVFARQVDAGAAVSSYTFVTPDEISSGKRGPVSWKFGAMEGGVFSQLDSVTNYAPAVAGLGRNEEYGRFYMVDPEV